ncbi:2-oxoglutarate oxidoreductase subunit KorA [Pelotomaculum schinkii]|uniref:2-oxoglutarate oxidoreductase subunit KorA n=1 Tax=Pelotomaculum schinkii TaxID=78350 RepID=A0A4Y7R6U9_9FIRM|nr:2-oxoacid:acceptor oxidoreductase subunit alpha [Pelotomaculum schinkii]TEB04462.1 2-oxoglutarate oxidoreductase subunit KorA [Pelotomaculum schinkii]
MNGQESSKVFMQGNAAIAEGAVAAGARFYAGYPITPSSEVAELASQKMLETGGVYVQMEDELGSIAAVIGAALTGKKAFTATSGPGFSLMQENLGVAILGEVPCVVVNVQRSGPSTGLATKPAQADVMQACWGRHGDQLVIVLTPASVQECFDLTVTAFNLSEQFRVPVILLADEIVGHMREAITLPRPEELKVVNRKKPDCAAEKYLPFSPSSDGVPPLASFGSDYIFHITSSMHGESGYSQNDPANAGEKIKRLFSKIEDRLDEFVLYKHYYDLQEDLDLLIITFGCTTRPARAAAMRVGDKKIGVLQLITMWPFPDKIVAQAAAKTRAILVPELNLGQVIREVERVAGKQTPVYGLHKSNGEGFKPSEIIARIEEVTK